MMSPNGFDNLLFFLGIVEDVADETNSGRVKVRAFGIHPPLDAPDGGIPTEDLPWAVPINGSYRSSVQVPRKSDWVFGFFIDGRDAQHPFLVGSIEGINLAAMNNSGAPTESGYQDASNAAYNTYGKPPLHSFVTGENLEETPELIKATMIKSSMPSAKIPMEDGSMGFGSGFDEFAPVQTTENFRSVVMPARFGDSFIGISDSEEDESIVVSHSSGTHIQIDSNGFVKIRSSGDVQIISEDDSTEYTGGSKSETHQSGWNFLVQDGSAVMEVNGDLHHVVHGDYNLNVAGRIAMTSGLGLELAASRLSLETTSEHINIKSAEKIKMQSGDITSIKSGTQLYLNSSDATRIKAGNTMDLTSASTLSIRSTGSDIGIDASRNVYLNSGVAGTAQNTPESILSPKVNKPVSQSIGSGGNQGGISSSGPNSSPGNIGSGAATLDDGTMI